VSVTQEPVEMFINVRCQIDSSVDKSVKDIKCETIKQNGTKLFNY
jgi:hypothetical protein